MSVQNKLLLPLTMGNGNNQQPSYRTGYRMESTINSSLTTNISARVTSIRNYRVLRRILLVQMRMALLVKSRPTFNLSLSIRINNCIANCDNVPNLYNFG